MTQLVLDPEWMDTLVIDTIEGIGDQVTSKIDGEGNVTIPLVILAQTYGI